MNRTFNVTQLDWKLISVMFLIILIGMIVIYSSSAGMESGNERTFYRQLIWLCLGLVLATVAFIVPAKLLFAFAYIIYFFAVLLLVIVLMQGKSSGLERWIGIGGLRFQPSEFAKIAVVVAVARFLSQYKVGQNNLKNLLIVFALVAVPLYLVKEQPDLGTSLVYMAIIIPMLYWAGIHPFILFVLISPLISVIASGYFYFFLVWMLIVLAVLFLSRKTLIVVLGLFILNISVGVMTPYLWNKLKPYQQERILNVLDPKKDPRGTGYQVLQSLNAIGSGGITGKGFMKGTQTQLRFLPEQHTDFIFSVLGEEFGFAGVSITLLLFSLLIIRMVSIAASVKSRFEGLIVIGFASVILFHIFVNTGMTVGIMPVTGLPLPFLSSGGSFLISMILMMGIVLNIAYNRNR